MTGRPGSGRGGAGGRWSLPPGLHAVSEGLAFLLELLALGGLAWWGADAGGGVAAKILLGAGAPVLAAVAWGLFAAPRARFQVPLAAVLVVKVLVFGAATAGVYAIGRHGLAIAFGAVVLVSTALATIDRDALKNQAAGSAASR
ncbi:MAG TPA: YrdB family protein [Streptosporangiaceae bacterium]|jgi:hypothetical protein